MGYCLDFPHGWQILGDWLYYWQTLIAGGLAIGAAWLGASAIYSQTERTTELTQNEINRRHNSARCVLPLTLSSIGNLCGEMADAIIGEIDARNDPNFNATFDAAFPGARMQFFAKILIDKGNIESLRSFVETLVDEVNIRHMAEFISSLQICLSRYGSFDLSQVEVVDRLLGLLIDVAKVLFLNDAIFNYGRFVDDSHFSVVGPLSHSDAWDGIHGKATGLTFHWPTPQTIWMAVNEKIERYKRDNISPWNEKFEE